MGRAFPVHELGAERIRELILSFHEPTAQAAVADEGTRETLRALSQAEIQMG